LPAQGALRWRADAPEDPAAARERVLDAAEECFARQGVSKTTVEDVARAAGISRATVYRYFSAGRDEIILGVVVREADRYLTRLDGRIEGQADLADAIVEFVSTTVHAARREERLGRLFTMAEVGTASRMLDAGWDVLFGRCVEFWRPHLHRWAGQVRPGLEETEIAEHLLRTVLSLLTVRGPSWRDREAIGTYVRRYVAPAICTDTTSTSTSPMGVRGRPY
jgi:AcrR family transcriptional regulator